MENLTYQHLCSLNRLTETEANTFGYCRQELINLLTEENYKPNK